MKKPDERELSCRRSEYLKNLRISTKISHRTNDLEILISIQTYNIQKHHLVELVMRTLNDLDSLNMHIVKHYGGHIIPFLSHDIFSQKDMEKLNLKVQDYLVSLQHNKYCRQDSHFYCFLIEQSALFPKLQAYDRVLRNAADLSRKYLSTFFTRKSHISKNMKELISSYTILSRRVEDYQMLKEVALIKIKEFVCFDEAMGLFAELTTVPCMAVEPQEEEIDMIWKILKSSDALIGQAKEAHARWEILVENVRELESNVYKGLHEDVEQLQIKEAQLKHWNECLDIQFSDLTDYLSDKMDKVAKFIFEIKRKIIDFVILTASSDEERPEEHWRKAAIQITKQDQHRPPLKTNKISQQPQQPKEGLEENDRIEGKEGEEMSSEGVS